MRNVLVILSLFMLCNSLVAQEHEIDFKAYNADGDVNKHIISKSLILKNKGGLTNIKTLVGQTNNAKCNISLNTDVNTVVPRSMYKEIKPSVLVVNNIYTYGNNIDAQNNSATAFVLKKEGICMTNAHVFQSYSDDEFIEYVAATVMDYRGNIYPIEKILAFNKKEDIAIFKIKTDKPLKELPVNTNFEVGDPISLVAHPNARFYFFSQGIISRKYVAEISKVDRISITADFAKGSSGGPVCDKFGNVVAMVASTDYIYYRGKQNQQMVIKECIPIKEIFKLIESEK